MKVFLVIFIIFFSGNTFAKKTMVVISPEDLLMSKVHSSDPNYSKDPLKSYKVNPKAAQMLKNLSKIPDVEIRLVPTSKSEYAIIKKLLKGKVLSGTGEKVILHKPTQYQLDLERKVSPGNFLYVGDRKSYFQNSYYNRTDKVTGGVYFKDYQDYLKRRTLIGGHVPIYKNESEFNKGQKKIDQVYSKIVEGIVNSESRGNRFTDVYGNLGPSHKIKYKIEDNLKIKYKWLQKYGRTYCQVNLDDSTYYISNSNCEKKLGVQLIFSDDIPPQCHKYTQDKKILLETLPGYECEKDFLKNFHRKYVNHVKPLCVKYQDCIQNLDRGNKNSLLLINRAMALLIEKEKKYYDLEREASNSPAKNKEYKELASLQSFFEKALGDCEDQQFSEIIDPALKGKNALTDAYYHFVDEQNAIMDAFPQYMDDADFEKLKKREKENLISCFKKNYKWFNPEDEYNALHRCHTIDNTSANIKHVFRLYQEKYVDQLKEKYGIDLAADSFVDLYQVDQCQKLYFDEYRDKTILAQKRNVEGCLAKLKEYITDQAISKISNTTLKKYMDNPNFNALSQMDNTQMRDCISKLTPLIQCKNYKEEVILKEYEKINLSLVLSDKFRSTLIDFPQHRQIIRKEGQQLKYINCLTNSRLQKRPKQYDMCMDEVEHKLEKKFKDYEKFSDEEDQAYDALMSDFSPTVRKLEHDLTVFHWAKAQNMHLTDPCEQDFESYHRKENIKLDKNDKKKSENSLPCYDVGPNNLKALIYANVMSDMFDWKLDDDERDSNFVGRGLYAARDPNSTEGYGKIMLEIEIPEKTKYMDISKTDHNFPLSDGTKRLLKKAGCHIYDGQKQSFMKDDDCRKIFLKVVDDLDVDFLSYSYNSGSVSFCDDNPSVAFVLFDVSLNPNTVDVHTYDGLNKAKEGTSAFERYEKLAPLTTRFNPNTGKGVTEKQKSYWKKRIYGCDSKNNETPFRNGQKFVKQKATEE